MEPLSLPVSKAAASHVRLSDLLHALSFALDMTEGQPAGHCARAARIGTAIGREIGLKGDEIRELHYAILLKDLGCSSNAARVCELYLSDDLAFKRSFKSLDDGLPQVLRFVIENTGLGAGLSERFRAIVHIFRNGGEIARELIETRCERGAAIARRLRFSETVAGAIHSLDEHWDGRGKPERLKGEAIPLFARIALLAQIADVFACASGPPAAIAEVRRRAGRWFDPALVLAFERCARLPDFWEEVAAAGIEDAVGFVAPDERVDEDFLDVIAEAFGEIVDSKSPYTGGHCDRVCVFADMIAEELGLSAERRRRLKRASLLHDIGKLGVSSAVLDKPGKLDDGEWAQMRRHPVHGEAILSRIPAFRELAEIAGAHHERLDGKGYPRGLAADAIGLETRIVSVADVFDALTADRPYREAMPVSRAFAILDEEQGRSLDPVCISALKAALARAEGGMATPEAA